MAKRKHQLLLNSGKSTISFFFIGNRTFFEKMNIMFMMMNTLDVTKLQKAQVLNLTANKL